MSENQENTTKKEGKKRVRRIPAPFEQIKKTKVWRLVATIVAALAIAAITWQRQRKQQVCRKYTIWKHRKNSGKKVSLHCRRAIQCC